MSPTVYGNLPSTRARRVLLLLEELGVEYNLKTLDFAKAEHRVSLSGK
jgi:glutathione S-transferase